MEERRCSGRVDLSRIVQNMMTRRDESPAECAETRLPHHARPPAWSDWFWKQARKIVVLVVGTTVVLIGLAGLLLPVLPGWALIFVGLFILGTEFAWAKWVLKMAKERAGQMVDAAKHQMMPGNGSPPEK